MPKYKKRLDFYRHQKPDANCSLIFRAINMQKQAAMPYGMAAANRLNLYFIFTID
jgi:hypothetical protein